jgi:hypothetical protein
MTVRDDIHRLVDALTEHELPEAQRLLESLRDVPDDPLTRALDAAPFDDEPTTLEEDREAAAAREEVRRGETVSAEEIKRTLLA